MPNTYKQVFGQAKKRLQEAPIQARNDTAIAFAFRVIPRVPVDTGAARANWNVSVGAPDMFADKLGRLDPTATETPRRLRREILAAGQGVLVIGNFLAYISVLEHGHSRQAPNGFLRLTVAEVSQLATAFLANRLGAKVKITGFTEA